MIRYEIELEGVPLRELVEALKPGWLDRAAERTEGFVSDGEFSEKSSIWSEIKPVFIHLQKRKCVFCERALPGERYGKGEHDLEHFRPKSSVKKWPTASIRRDRKLDYDFATGDAAAPGGYYWLAYDLENYATACKSCNSALKSNFFPIAGPRGAATASVSELHASEEPFLIYPLGELDDDPEELISFVGIVAVPRSDDDNKRRRARVTIDFFELNNRDELWDERFAVIRSLWQALRNRENALDPAERDDARVTIKELVDNRSPHASCARNFLALYEDDPREAWRIYREARDSLPATAE